MIYQNNLVVPDVSYRLLENATHVSFDKKPHTPVKLNKKYLIEKVTVNRRCGVLFWVMVEVDGQSILKPFPLAYFFSGQIKKEH